MAHKEQADYCEKIKNKLPSMFSGKRVLDVGSLDINGNNRYLFENSSYLGIDVGAGKNVDVVSTAHEFESEDNYWDVIISTECFEHDMHYQKSMQRIVQILKPGGLFIFTCATTGRPEHGTRASDGNVNAPLLSELGEWSDYYKNLTESDVAEAIDLSAFSEYEFEVNETACDLYFYGIKK